MSEDEGATIHRISTFRQFARYSYLPDYPSVQGLLRRIDPDVVYSRVGSPLVGFAARYCKQHNRSLVHHIARLDDVLPRTELPPQNLIRNLERRIYEAGIRQANAVVAQADYQAALLARHFDIRSAHVIPNYHPAPAEAPVKRAHHRLVLWVANVKAAKRPEAFVELARHFQDVPDTRFMMIGSLSDKRYAPLIADAQRMRNFTYAGPAPLEEVNRVMDSAHIFVNTSVALGEGFPNTFIQAWLRGAVVISLEVDPDSLLSDGRRGICSSNSMEQMVQNLNSLLFDPDRLARMGAFARGEALQRYGKDNFARLQTLLEQCAARSATT